MKAKIPLVVIYVQNGKMTQTDIFTNRIFNWLKSDRVGDVVLFGMVSFQMALEIYISKTTTVGEMCMRLGIAKRTF